MRLLVLLPAFALMTLLSAGDVLHVPGDFGSVAQAAAAAQPGDIIELAQGTYDGAIKLGKSVTLRGGDPERCILQCGRDETVLTVSGETNLDGLTIQGGENGIMVRAGASLTLEDCRIIGNKSDGIGFENAFNTQLFLDDCFVAENGDGIDLESTQAVILNCRFVNNRDDGLDLDGDAGALVYGCTFADNRDDGIEIRLATRTHALIQKCRFERNGEDGVEIINSPKEQGIYNLLCVQNSAFDGNKRFGVGFVEHEKESATGEMSKTAVYAAGNTFIGTGAGAVSLNYASVFAGRKDYPQTVTAAIRRGEKQTKQEVTVQIPVLAGIYNLRPTTDGTMVADAEGVAVSNAFVFVADDNNRTVYVLDRRTGQVARSFSTAPFPRSDYEAPGPEGLDVIKEDDGEALLLSDDDGRGLYTLSLQDETFGQVLRRQDTAAIGPVEGVEMVGGLLVAAANRTKLYQIRSDDFSLAGSPVEVGVQGFGAHIAGAGASEANDRLFITVSGYAGLDQKFRNHQSAFVELDSELEAVRGFWHLGPFSNDPRGIALLDGLVYVADGRSDFTDEQTGEVNRGGIKVFVFLIEDDPEALRRVLRLLPLRRDRAGNAP